MRINFAELLSPLTVEEFFQVYWEKKILHLRQTKADYFQGVVDIKAIDEYLTRPDLAPIAVRLTLKGADIPAANWTEERHLTDGRKKSVVVSEKIFTHFQKGATIIVNDAQKGIRKLAKACIALEQELKISLQSNVYITPPNSQGFTAHYDPHDIFSLQIAGTKDWRIYDSGENLPTKVNPFRETPKLLCEFQRQPGDLLYIPRGVVHEASSSDAATVHVNFSLKPRYGFHLLEDLRTLAEEENVFFRKVIPNGFATEGEKLDYAADFARQLSDLIDRHAPEKLIERQFETFVERQQIDFQNRLVDLLEVGKLKLTSTISWRGEMSFTVKRDGDGISIKFGKREVTIPKFVEPEVFLRDEPFAVGDVKGLLTASGKIELIKQLVETGFLKIENL
jgi:ribosomal protein L16 Arg81 hydroxylase